MSLQCNECNALIVSDCLTCNVSLIEPLVIFSISDLWVSLRNWTANTVSWLLKILWLSSRCWQNESLLPSSQAMIKLQNFSGKMLALWEIHPPLLFSSDMGTFCWIGLNVFNMFSQLSTSVTPFSQDHYCKCNSGPNNTLQYHAISHSTRQYQAIPRIQ